MTRKLMIECAHKIAKERDGKCLSDNYINNSLPLKWQCNKDKHIWTTSYNSIQHGTWCPKCAGKQKLTILDLQKLAKERDGVCLSKKYINSHTKIIFKCNKDNCIWKAIPGNVVYGSWCPKCGKENMAIEHAKKHNLAEIKEIAKAKDGICLSDEYENTKTKLKFKCNKDGHEWITTANVILQGYWCQKCAGLIKLTIQQIQDIAKERGGVCLSKEYINSNNKLKFKCNKCNHEWLLTPNGLMAGNWCPTCKSLRSEKLCREYLEKKTKMLFPKIKPAWLNGLELDGYCKELNLAFEYNGKQHYKFVNIFHTSNRDLKAQQTRDKIKEELCIKKKIMLIKIPYKFNSRNYKMMYNFIDSQLNILGIKI